MISQVVGSLISSWKNMYQRAWSLGSCRQFYPLTREGIPLLNSQHTPLGEMVKGEMEGYLLGGEPIGFRDHSGTPFSQMAAS